MEYYSSRNERLLNSSNEVKKAYENRNRKGFFKKNPHLKMMLIDLSIILLFVLMLIDLSIILLFVLIIVPIFQKINSNIKIYDFNINSKAFVFEEKLLVTIKVEKAIKKINNKEQFGELSIIIKSINNEELGIKNIFLTKETKKEYINFTFPFSNNIENIIINLSLNNYDREYTVKIDNQ